MKVKQYVKVLEVIIWVNSTVMSPVKTVNVHKYTFNHHLYLQNKTIN